MRKTNRKILFTLLGLVAGALIVHPYIMLVYHLTAPGMKESGGTLAEDIAETFFSIFSPEMLPMTLSFSFFCGVIGFLSAILLERNRRLAEMHFEARQHETVRQSLQKLVSVISHFVINSSLTVGYNIRQIKKRICSCSIPQAGEKKTASDPAEMEEMFDIILRQEEKNQEVLKLVGESQWLETLESSDTSVHRIVELTKQIEERIASEETGSSHAEKQEEKQL